MSQNVPLNTGDPASEAFFDATQEMLSGASVNFEVVILDPTHVRVPAGPGEAQVSIAIDGLYRWMAANVDRAHPGGGAGTYDLSVTARANAAGGQAPPGNDYTFALAITAEGVAPVGAEVYRVVRKVIWSGAAITRVDRLEVEGPARHAASHAAGGTDPVTPAAIGGATAADLAAETAARAAGDANNPTAGQKAALAGTSGAPGAGNEYVTDDDPRNTNARTPAAHAASHRVGGTDELVRAVLAAQAVLDVGQLGQIRAGRQLSLADFTALLGLAAPVAAWRLSDLTDYSGAARDLTNKGAVPFGVGINGAAATAAVFAGSTGQALYIADAGAGDPFRIKTGSWGGWLRVAKRATTQYVLAKFGATQPTRAYYLAVNPSNVVQVGWGDGAADYSFGGVTDVCDDRWHFAVGTFDGSITCLYVDGVLETAYPWAGLINPAATPLNIGGRGADAGTAATEPFFGRVDEAFVTEDVLSEDQVRLLYAAKVAHGYAVTPTRASVAARRRRRGGALAVGDFPAQPVRLHNFVAGALTDQGSGNVPLAAVGGGSIVKVAAPDGTREGAYAFSGAHTGLGATDAGLPAALVARSYGVWFKRAAPPAGSETVIGWGTVATGDARVFVAAGSGVITASSAADVAQGPNVTDGLWHMAVVVEDNAPADGLKRKLYLDGQLVATSTTLNPIVLAGANRFRVGAEPAGGGPMIGQASRPWVHAGALTPEQVRALYAVGSVAAPPSPLDAGAVLEALDATSAYLILDALDSQHQIDLEVTT